MSVPTSAFYDPIRALIGDDDPDIQMVSDSAIDSKIRLIVNSGKIRGHSMDTTGLQIQVSTPSTPTHYTWADWSDYRFGFGYGSYTFMYGNPYSLFYDQAFQWFANYTPAAQQSPDSNDLTPTGDPRGWARLVYEVGRKFISIQTDYHFRTRSVTETIKAPKDLLWDIQLELDDLINGGRASERPLALPLIAIGVRSLMNGSWWAPTAGIGIGYEFLGYSLSY